MYNFDYWSFLWFNFDEWMIIMVLPDKCMFNFILYFEIWLNSQRHNSWPCHCLHFPYTDFSSSLDWWPHRWILLKHLNHLRLSKTPMTVGRGFWWSWSLSSALLIPLISTVSLISRVSSQIHNCKFFFNQINKFLNFLNVILWIVIACWSSFSLRFCVCFHFPKNEFRSCA